ncbi:uncharacterized protein LOC120286102 [Eucalyptus grandis]|uniref:uncharacterized protein LOC120286102 n=1 Tax=Eucalyptus grandis TaxID=71139 RepID=UPI00192EFA65|nr:uncharacterized protein LOC120286102 [Eucalyptus grandis]
MAQDLVRDNRNVLAVDKFPPFRSSRRHGVPGERLRRAPHTSGAPLPPEGDEPGDLLCHQHEATPQRQRPQVGDPELPHVYAPQVLQPHGAGLRSRKHWRRTHADIDRHVVPVHGPIAEGLSDEAAVNEYLADLSTNSPGLLGDDNPLWFTLVFVVEIMLRSMWASDRKKSQPRESCKLGRALAGAHSNNPGQPSPRNRQKRLLRISGISVREGTRITGVAVVNLREQQGLQAGLTAVPRSSFLS